MARSRVAKGWWAELWGLALAAREPAGYQHGRSTPLVVLAAPAPGAPGRRQCSYPVMRGPLYPLHCCCLCRMYDFCLTFPYAALLAVGGIIGWITKGSSASLCERARGTSGVVLES